MARLPIRRRLRSTRPPSVAPRALSRSQSLVCSAAIARSFVQPRRACHVYLTRPNADPKLGHAVAFLGGVLGICLRRQYRGFGQFDLGGQPIGGRRCRRDRWTGIGWYCVRHRLRIWLRRKFIECGGIRRNRSYWRRPRTVRNDAELLQPIVPSGLDRVLQSRHQFL